MAVLQTLNLNPESYQRRLREIKLSPYYYLQLIGQKIQATCMKWLWPEKHTMEERVEGVCVKHYLALLPFKPKWWVTCLKPWMMPLESLEAYMSVEVGICLMKNLKKQAARAEPNRSSCRSECRLPANAPPDKDAPARDCGLELPTPLFNWPRPKGLTSKCFRCGQVSHSQDNCPHMDCTWVKSV